MVLSVDSSHVKEGSAFKPPVNIYQSAQRHIPQDLNLQQFNCDKLKSQLIM
jgi:hypothetical protein